MNMHRNRLDKSPVYFFPEFAKGEEDPNVLMKRLNLYGAAYNRVSSGEKLKVLIGINQKKMKLLKMDEYLDIEIIHVTAPTKNFLKFAILCHHKLRKKKIHAEILIAGDVYIAFLTTLLIKIFSLRKYLPIQISVHGFYLENLEFSNRKFSKFLKMYLLMTYRIANSIRVVSPEIKESLSTKYEIGSSKIFVSPIPLDMGKSCQSLSRTVDVLFVGRFHEERGIDQLTEIIKVSKCQGLNFKFVVVGSGPLLIEFQDTVSNLLPNIRFEGTLGRNELNQLYCSSRILLSTAPTEGYGLTIREALSQGCLLIARKNEVTANLAMNFPKLVFLFESKEEAIYYLNKMLKDQADTQETQAFRNFVQNTNSESLYQLSMSWVKRD